eukprot:352972-Chlamydomonas_euryale.AAC.9
MKAVLCRPLKVVLLPLSYAQDMRARSTTVLTSWPVWKTDLKSKRMCMFGSRSTSECSVEYGDGGVMGLSGMAEAVPVQVGDPPVAESSSSERHAGRLIEPVTSSGTQDFIIV